MDWKSDTYLETKCIVAGPTNNQQNPEFYQKDGMLSLYVDDGVGVGV